MADATDQAGNAASEPAIHVVLVPEHLRNRVEEHVRQLAEEQDVSAFAFEAYVRITGKAQGPLTGSGAGGSTPVSVSTAASCTVGGGTDYRTDYSY